MTNAEHFHLKKICYFLYEQKIFNFSCHNAATINFDSRGAKKLQDMKNILFTFSSHAYNYHLPMRFQRCSCIFEVLVMV